jgi:S1-C subfamily serine protease
LGIKVRTLDKKSRRRYRILAEQGVVITDVRDGAHLAHIGVAAGDVIVQIDDRIVASLDDFSTAMIKCRLKSSVLLLVQRDERVYYLTVRMSP